MRTLTPIVINKAGGLRISPEVDSGFAAGARETLRSFASRGASKPESVLTDPIKTFAGTSEQALPHLLEDMGFTEYLEAMRVSEFEDSLQLFDQRNAYLLHCGETNEGKRAEEHERRVREGSGEPPMWTQDFVQKFVQNGQGEFPTRNEEFLGDGTFSLSTRPRASHAAQQRVSFTLAGEVVESGYFLNDVPTYAGELPYLRARVDLGVHAAFLEAIGKSNSAFASGMITDLSQLRRGEDDQPLWERSVDTMLAERGFLSAYREYPDPTWGTVRKRARVLAPEGQPYCQVVVHKSSNDGKTRAATVETTLKTDEGRGITHILSVRADVRSATTRLSNSVVLSRDNFEPAVKP